MMRIVFEIPIIQHGYLNIMARPPASVIPLLQSRATGFIADDGGELSSGIIVVEIDNK